MFVCRSSVFRGYKAHLSQGKMAPQEASYAALYWAITCRNVPLGPDHSKKDCNGNSGAGYFASAAAGVAMEIGRVWSFPSSHAMFSNLV